MFRKLKFNSANQKSALYLEKQKKLENSAKCAMCSQTVCLKEAFTEIFRKIGQKTKKMCANIPTSSFYLLPLIKVLKRTKNKQISFRNNKKKATIFLYVLLHRKIL
jgi:hypothetical protein